MSERARQAAKQPPPDQKDVPLLFFQTFPEGTFFWPHPPLSLLSFYFFSPPLRSPLPSSRSFQKRLLEARIYLFSHCCSNFPSARNKCFALGVKRQGERERGRETEEKGAHSVAGQPGLELLLWSGSDRRSEMTQAWTAYVCISRLYICAYLSALPLICVS